MSYYEVLLSSNLQQDPVSIFDPSVKEMVLINAVVHLNAQSAGSFEFTVPRQHIFYDKIVPMGSNIEVKENGRTIFFGRPLPPTLDFFGNMVYHCEGALAFLNDAYLPPIENAFEEIEFNALLDLVLSQYNSTQTRLDRVFSYDPSQFPDVMIYDAEQWNYQTVLDYLRDYMHQFVGGFFYAEWDNGILQFEWKEKLTETSNQPITFGVNLLEMTRTGKMFYTAAIAKGGQNLDGEVAQMLSPKKMDNTLLAEYGTITAYLEYPDATTVDALDAYCDTYLREQRFDGLTLEMTAADLHLRNTEYNEFRVGQLVRVVSKPHDVERTLPITQIEVDINSALKKAIIGDLDKIPFTVSVKKAKKETEKKAKEDAKEEAKKEKDKPYSPGDNPVIKGKDGNDYVLTVDDDVPVVEKIPSNIKISPTLYNYTVGSAFDLSQFTVTAYYGDGSSKNVTSSCSYSIPNGYVFVNKDPHYQLIATYKEYGKSYTASAKLMPSEGEGIVARPDSYVTDAGTIISENEGVRTPYTKVNDGRAAVLIAHNASDPPEAYGGNWFAIFSVALTRDASIIYNNESTGTALYNIRGHEIWLSYCGMSANYGGASDGTNPLGLPEVYDVPLFPVNGMPSLHQAEVICNILRVQFISDDGSGYSDDSGGSESGGGGHFGDNDENGGSQSGGGGNF